MKKNPNPYHIALDCIDKHARSLENKNKTALTVVREGEAQVQKLTYSQLMGLTNRMANALTELGLKKGDRLLLRLFNGAEFPITFLGALKGGIIPIPSSPLFTWEELKFLLADSGAAALVTSVELLPQELMAKSPNLLKKIILLAPKEMKLPKDTLRWQSLLKEASSKFSTPPTSETDPAFWLYTSGTTGQPKASIHAHRSIKAHDERCRRWLDVKAGDVIFNTSALNWSYALTAGMLDLLRHGLHTVVYQGPLSPERICQVIVRHGVHTLMSVPGLYRRLAPYLKDHPNAFAKVRLCLSAGENLRSATRRAFREATGLEIHEGLGMTENSVYLIQPAREKPVEKSLGRPVFPGQVKILREDLTEAAAGEVGILATHRDCPGLMLGYYQGGAKPDLPLQGDWFLSGDLAHRDTAGNFYFDGRRDDVITAGGYRISPLEVEKVLNQHPLVEESAVVGKEIEDKKLVEAHLVLKDPHGDLKRLREDILKYCNTHLAPYKIPRIISFQKIIPKTVTGKIKRKDLS